MTDDPPISCSLGAGDLERRLAAIAEVGTDSLISREDEGGRHRLHFRVGADVRRKLQEIVAAEAECCSFLDLSLNDQDGQLVLSIAAPRGGQPIADELAAAFAVDSPQD
jgi:hypothetical protein